MTDEQQLRERAAKRWQWRLIILGLCGALAGSLFGTFLVHHRHHESPAASVAGALVGVAVVGGLFVLATRRHSRLLAGDGWFSAPLVVGLGRKQRRATARAVRRLQPSTVPLLRSVERDLAYRSVRYARRSVAFFVIVVPLVVLFGVIADVTTAGRIYFLVSASLLASGAVRTVFFGWRAKAYLKLLD